ncbi:MAG: universal stress protein [Cyclobacteriaceae bacterium]
MYKNILIPTDFSQESQNALATGVEFIQRHGGTVHLLNVVEDPYASSGMRKLLDLPEDPMAGEMAKKLKENALNHLQAESDKYPDTDIDLIVRMGNPFKSIKIAADDLGVDLVIMGTNGASGMEEIMLGSTTEKIVRNVKCPVFSIKAKADIVNVKSIIYPTDMRPEHEKIVNDLKELQKFYGAHLHLVKVFDSNMVLKREIEERLKEFAEYFNLENYSTAAVQDPEEAETIIRFAEEMKADMIAMATHFKRGIEVIVTSQISRNVVSNAKRPIWTKRVN